MNDPLTFTIPLSWSEEEGASVGQGADLVGVAGTGSTSEEALASVPEAIHWWQGCARPGFSGRGSRRWRSGC